ncbi:membrane-associating domain-containing protein [Nemania serpens]|nr:membrane-associating domain-containing protein [Nemania serpens]
MALTFVPIVHIVAAIFAIVELGLTAYWASLWNGGFAAYSYSPPTINFLVFASVWSILVLIYIGLTPLYLTSAFHRLAALALNVVTAIFWFAGAIAAAVGFGGPYNCHGDSGCSDAEAAIAFAFFLWAIFTFLAVVDGLESLRRRGHHVETSKSTNAYPSA